jgi:predicted Zn-dependent peptidase
VHVDIRASALNRHRIPLLAAALMVPYAATIALSLGGLPAPVANVGAATARAPGVLRTRFANGLTLVVVPVRGAHLARVTTTYRVGAADDPPDRSGLSHAVEHLMFWGSRRYPRADQFARWQAMGGAVNAFTGEHETRFIGFLPAPLLGSYLDIEADRMTGARMDDAAWRAERPVIAHELDDRAASPVAGLMAAARGALAGTRRPLDPGGTRAGIARIGAAEARAWYRRWYVPSNATVTVVGDVDAAAVTALARGSLGVVAPRHAAPGHAARAGTPLAHADTVVAGTQAFADLVYVLPGARDPAYADTVLLADMLVHAPYPARPPHFVFQPDATRTVVHAVVTGATIAERDANAAAAAQAIASLARDGITAPRTNVSLARASLRIASAPTLSQGGELWDAHLVDPAPFVAALLHRSRADVARTARAALAQPVVTANARPTGSAAAKAADAERVGIAPIAPRRAVPTVRTADVLAALPAVRAGSLPNGLRYAVVPTAELTARVVVRADAALPDAAFAAGGARYGASDRRRVFDQFGMAGRLGRVSDVRCMPADLDRALAMVADAVRHPRLRRGQSGAVAPRDVGVVVFGPASPAEVDGAVRAAFGDWPAGPRAAHRQVPAVRPPARDEVVIRYALPAADSPEFPAAMLVTDVLAGNDPMSLLNRRLRFADQLTFGVRSGIVARAGRSQLELSFVVPPGRRREALAAWRGEMRRFVREGVSPLDLSLGRSRLLAVVLLSSGDDAAVAANLLGVLPGGHADRYFPRVITGIGAVSAAGFRRSAAAYFCERCAAVAAPARS